MSNPTMTLQIVKGPKDVDRFWQSLKKSESSAPTVYFTVKARNGRQFRIDMVVKSLALDTYTWTLKARLPQSAAQILTAYYSPDLPILPNRIMVYASTESIPVWWLGVSDEILELLTCSRTLFVADLERATESEVIQMLTDNLNGLMLGCTAKRLAGERFAQLRSLMDANGFQFAA